MTNRPRPGIKGSEGARGRRGARDGNTKDELPSEKWGVLTRDEVDHLAALVAGLTEWVRLLQELLERMNDSLMVAKAPPQMGPKRALSFYDREEPHPNQQILWDGFDLTED